MLCEERRGSEGKVEGLNCEIRRKYASLCERLRATAMPARLELLSQFCERKGWRYGQRNHH
jgi:hypothetical protein